MSLTAEPASKPQRTVAQRCRDAGGLLEVSLGDLRLELGYAKLGRWVLEEITQNLTKSKLGVFPASRLDPAENAEPRKEQTVWVYDRDGGLRAQVIDAVLDPDSHDVHAALDRLAAGQAEKLTKAQKLERIREVLDAPEKPTVRIRKS